MTTHAASCHWDNNELICEGDWDLHHFSMLQDKLARLSIPTQKAITINGTAIKKMDSAGAWLINFYQAQLKNKQADVHLKSFPENYLHLLKIIKKNTQEELTPPQPKKIFWMSRLGMYAVYQVQSFNAFLAFIGGLCYEFMRIIAQPKHFRLSVITNIIFRNGFLALPIIALLSSMIGVVITFQMGLLLRNYGANIYIVDLLGLSILREFGPLLTAIMVAGRTGSAFTAQLGIMKINQEIDALDTMGVTPAELLLLPRIIGLIIALPLLTIWADIFGVLGGMLMSKNMLNISWYDFLHRFPHVIKLRNLLIGLGKAPVFALIIASIGCFQGMTVEGSAESIGKNTTRSVVLAIFFIIVADALFSVIFSKLKL